MKSFTFDLIKDAFQVIQGHAKFSYLLSFTFLFFLSVHLREIEELNVIGTHSECTITHNVLIVRKLLVQCCTLQCTLKKRL